MTVGESRPRKCMAFRLMLVILLSISVWLWGCARLGLQDGAGMPPVSGDKETPAFTGITSEPAPRAVTPGAGDDQPVSSRQTITPLGQKERGRVVGRVLDTKGKPLARAIIAIVQGTAPYPERTYLTDENGLYRIILEPGRYTLAAFRDGYVQTQGEVQIESGKESVLDLILQAK